jgi:hypothetical protein
MAILAGQPASPARSAEEGGGEVLARSMQLFAGDPVETLSALDWLRRRGNTDAVPALIQYRRFSQGFAPQVDAVLRELTGEAAPASWHDWMLWQEDHPEIVPFPGFDRFKAEVVRLIDPNFELFLHTGVAHEIRLEEIAWGGVRKDGIPALTNPALIGADAADYLKDDDLVFGVEINGDARAYPLRIMNWHEMFNDVVGGVPVSLAYCTLCGSGILFDTRVAGQQAPLVFGSSGFLYRSNKLMYDSATNSLWNQFTGRPVVGELTGSGIELKVLPVAITSWERWRAAHPRTRVLSLETGYSRDYGSGAAYREYFSSPDLMFPALLRRGELRAKDFVFALRGTGAEKAWPLTLFEGGTVINDTAGVLDLVLIGDAATRSVRAYASGARQFAAGAGPDELVEAGRSWRVTEAELVGPDGARLERLPGHIAYWFAWAGYLGGTGELGVPSHR